MSFEDGDRNAFVQVTRDHSAGVTWLFFGYSFLDPEDPNQLILVSGDGEIPASSLDVSSGSARLVLTTPDSYPVTRCVIDNTTGEYTCEVSGPSRLVLTWTADGHGSVETQARTVEQSGTVTASSVPRKPNVPYRRGSTMMAPIPNAMPKAAPGASSAATAPTSDTTDSKAPMTNPIKA
jgi:hypothetical protein